MKSSSELLQGLRCLSCERLSSDTDNLRLVDDFFNRRNDGIAQTLRNEAFAEDEEGSTAYYVVKHESGDILFFFSLKCGMLYDQFLDTRQLKLINDLNEYLDSIVQDSSLDEQDKIVNYLDCKTSKIDSYVADKEKEIDLLLELKQKTIADAVTKGLNPDVTKKDSGISWLGMIPENWETKRIASLFTGKVKANSDFEYHHAFKFYYGTLVPKEETGDIEEYRDTYVKYSVLQKDDIMINGLNLNYDFVSQRVAIAPSDGIITSAYVVVRPRIGTNAQYYNYLFKTMDNMKLVQLRLNYFV